MIHGKLNYNEKLVFYGMLRYPLLNDRELADKLKLKMTTVTAIKNRLKKNRYYSTIRVPVLENLGTELFCVMQTRFNPAIPEKEIIEKLGLITQYLPEFFYGAYDSGEGFGLALAHNYTEMLETIEKTIMGGRKERFIEFDDMPLNNFIFFPLSNCIIYNFFNFAPLLSREFKITLGDEPDTLEPSIPKPKDVSLTNIEKRVLYGLVNYPELPDSKISDKINITRQVISKLKKSFEDDGIMKTIRIPNLKLLGYDIIALSHQHFNPLTPIPKRKKGIKMILENLPIILDIAGNLDSFIMAVCKDFREFQEFKNQAISFYKKEEFLIGEPDINIYSIPNINIITNHSYGPIIKKIFDIKDI
jgi:DNA-binding MarR family transcriptional regulator